MITRYVNKVLADIPRYTGGVEWVHVNLFRRAYQIHDLYLHEVRSDTIIPFFKSKTIDLSVEWKSLFDGEVVGEIVLNTPSLVYLAQYLEAEESDNDSLDESVDWTEPIQELMPIQINRFEVTNGNAHYLNNFSDPQVDVYFENLDILATNLSNTTDEADPLPSDFNLSAVSIGNGTLEIISKLNIVKKVPNFDVDVSFEEVDLVALNDFLKANANADLNRGNMNFYSEVSGKDGHLTGYMKPIFNDLDFVNWK